MYVLTFSDDHYGLHKKTGVTELRPSLLCGLLCLIDLDF